MKLEMFEPFFLFRITSQNCAIHLATNSRALKRHILQTKNEPQHTVDANDK